MAVRVHTTSVAPSAIVPAPESDVARMEAGAFRLQALRAEAAADLAEAALLSEDTEEAIRADLVALVEDPQVNAGDTRVPALDTVVAASCPMPDNPALAAGAQIAHDRRALDGAAEHAVALGDALGIPAVDLGAALAGPAAGSVDAVGHAAGLDWEPWTGECPVPSGRDWPRIGAHYLPLARTAWCVNSRSKEDLMRALAELDEGDGSGVERLCDDIAATRAFFGAFHDLTETAEARVLVAMSAMTLDPRYRHRFAEERAA